MKKKHFKNKMQRQRATYDLRKGAIPRASVSPPRVPPPRVPPPPKTKRTARPQTPVRRADNAHLHDKLSQTREDVAKLSEEVRIAQTNAERTAQKLQALQTQLQALQTQYQTLSLKHEHVQALAAVKEKLHEVQLANLQSRQDAAEALKKLEDAHRKELKAKDALIEVNGNRTHNACQKVSKMMVGLITVVLALSSVVGYGYYKSWTAHTLKEHTNDTNNLTRDTGAHTANTANHAGNTGRLRVEQSRLKYHLQGAQDQKKLEDWAHSGTAAGELILKLGDMVTVFVDHFGTLPADVRFPIERNFDRNRKGMWMGRGRSKTAVISTVPRDVLLNVFTHASSLDLRRGSITSMPAKPLVRAFATPKGSPLSLAPPPSATRVPTGHMPLPEEKLKALHAYVVAANLDENDQIHDFASTLVWSPSESFRKSVKATEGLLEMCSTLLGRVRPSPTHHNEWGDQAHHWDIALRTVQDLTIFVQNCQATLSPVVEDYRLARQVVPILSSAELEYAAGLVDMTEWRHVMQDAGKLQPPRLEVPIKAIIDAAQHLTTGLHTNTAFEDIVKHIAPADVATVYRSTLRRTHRGGSAMGIVDFSAETAAMPKEYANVVALWAAMAALYPEYGFWVSGDLPGGRLAKTWMAERDMPDSNAANALRAHLLDKHNVPHGGLPLPPPKPPIHPTPPKNPPIHPTPPDHPPDHPTPPNAPAGPASPAWHAHVPWNEFATHALTHMAFAATTHLGNRFIKRATGQVMDGTIRIVDKTGEVHELSADVGQLALYFVRNTGQFKAIYKWAASALFDAQGADEWYTTMMQGDEADQNLAREHAQESVHPATAELHRDMKNAGFKMDDLMEAGESIINEEISQPNADECTHATDVHCLT